MENNYDVFPAFTPRITNSTYPIGFKPPPIDKYDDKTDPQMWLRCYSAAILAACGDDITKLMYFPIAIELGLLIWLQNLQPHSIDSWLALSKQFVNNFQGTYQCPGSRYDLASCKQKPDEGLREYNRRFFEKKATYVFLSDHDIIDIF